MTTSSDTPLTLVLGASGYIGSHLVPRLQASGLRVRAAARNAASLYARNWEGVEVSEADVLRPETLSAALAGVDTLYYLVHSTLITGALFLLAELIGIQRGKAGTRLVRARRLRQGTLLGWFFLVAAVAEVRAVEPVQVLVHTTRKSIKVTAAELVVLAVLWVLAVC